MKKPTWLIQIPRILRLHQWIKNGLIFVPALTAHRLTDPGIFKICSFAFLSFSFIASAVYIINDLVDMESDRLHPTKSRRPFASRQVPVQAGYFLVPVLIALGIAIGSEVGAPFVKVLTFYFAMTFAYSFYLKRLLLWDVICLASLYTIRIFAGSAATQIPISQLLLAFSLFIFLSLAFVKRVSELQVHRKKEGETIPGRGYQSVDEEALANLGASSGYLSVLVFAFYINSTDVTRFYQKPELLWFICPLILYWISRVWIIGNRGQLHDDPIVFALKDKVSYLVFIMTLGILFIAT